MSPAEQLWVFDRFCRGCKGARQRTRKGPGLGLTVCKRLTKAMAFQIEPTIGQNLFTGKHQYRIQS